MYRAASTARLRQCSSNPLPALDLRVLARRAALPAALAVVAVTVFTLAGGPLQAFADAFNRAIEADPRWVAAALVFELLSFTGYVALLWLVGRRATGRLGLRASAEISLGGTAATRLLPTGGVGGAALTIWAFRRAGLDTRGATRTLLAFLFLLYSVFLASIAVAGGLLTVGLASGGAPLALTALPALGATLVIAAALALALRAPAGRSGPTAAVSQAVRDAIALVRSRDPRLLGAIGWWAFDAAVLWSLLQALGSPPPLTVLVFAYFVGQVANTIPVPGAASGGMVAVLLAFGLEADLVLGAVLAYRSVAIWVPAPMGLVALGGLRRTVAGWAQEDGTPEETPRLRIAHPAPMPVAEPMPVAA